MYSRLPNVGLLFEGWKNVILSKLEKVFEALGRRFD